MGKKVVVADDALFMRKVISSILTEAGYEVVAEASDGDEALEAYRKFRPDVVTMDITMPYVDGIDGLRHIKKEFPDAKIIICSALGMDTKIKEAIMYGAVDFLIKPFKKEILIEKIKRICSE